MSQDYVFEYRARKKQKTLGQKTWQWLRTLGELFLELGRLLMSLGWKIYRIGEWLLAMLWISDWREDYR